MNTIFIKDNDIEHNWYVIDATGKSLGRVAAKTAAMLRGKHKATFSPHQEAGDYIVVVNAEKAVLTGTKKKDKLYHYHTGYLGGLVTQNYETLLAKKPEEPLRLAIKGMLPSGPLGRRLLGNVKIYAGSEHPHKAQNPQPVEF